MKLAACYIVLNQEKWLYYSLKSIYGQVDKIIIVEGCEESYRFSANDTGLSKDKTGEIIKNFPDIEKKIIYEQMGFVKYQTGLRNRYLKLMPEDITHFLEIDGDELYKADELAMLKSFVSKANHISHIEYGHLMFWRDSKHLYMSTVNAMKVVKFHRRIKGRFYRDNVLFYHQPIEGEKIYYLTGINLYHLGYVASNEEILNKLLWTYRREISRNNSIYLPYKNLSNNDLIEHIKKNDSHYTNQFNDAVVIINYFGDYPEVLHEKR